MYIGPLSTHTDLEQSEIIAKLSLPGMGQRSPWVPADTKPRDPGRKHRQCISASDPLPALIAADALIKVYGQDGERVCLLKDFMREREALLEPGEFIREFVVKKLPEGTRMDFPSWAEERLWPYPGLTALRPLPWTLREPLPEARIAPGCIFILPDRVEKAEQVLIGQKPSEELFAKAGKSRVRGHDRAHRRPLVHSV